MWAEEHHLSKAAEGFAAKLSYDGPYQVMDFASPVMCKIGHVNTKKERTIHVSELKQQQTKHKRATITCRHNRPKTKLKLKEHSKDPTKILQGCSKDPPRILQAHYRITLRILQDSSKDIPRTLQGHYKMTPGIIQ